MWDLKTCLERTPRRNLLVMARLRGVAAKHDTPKAELVERLHHASLDPRDINRQLRKLSPDEVKALEALVAAGGQMGLGRFTRRFGPIRPYKPWREDSPRHPWRNPISPAERLWYLGLIFQTTAEAGTEPLVVIPGDLLPLLPIREPPSLAEKLRPAPSITEVSGEGAATTDLLHDLALLLSSLHRQDVRPLYGRWLAPRHLHDWNRRCACPEDLAGVRSELQTGRLRFIHYLAEVAALVAPTSSYLKPTPAAWEWLATSPTEQLRALWKSWLAPTDVTRTLWRRYRLPGHEEGSPLEAVNCLVDGLAHCPTDEPFALDSLIEALQSADETLAGCPTETLDGLLTGPLAWLGILDIRPSAARLTAWGTWLLGLVPDPPPIAPAIPFILDDDLTVRLPGRPRTHHLVQLEAWAEWLGPDGEGQTCYRLTRESVADALHRGETLEGLYGLLTEGTGCPLLAHIQETLAGWAEEATVLTLRLCPVLEARDAALFRQLSARRRLRAYFRRTLSSRAVIVDGEHLEGLVRGLRRAGYLPDVQVSLGEYEASGELDAGAAAHLWAAARIYARLSQFIELPFRLPAGLLDRLAERMSPQSRAAAQAAVDRALERLEQAIDGWTPHPPPGPGLPVEETLALIEKAIAEGRTLTMAYWTGGRGVLTRRIVEPYRIEWRGDVPYLVAYCHLREDERVFRLDRIRECELGEDQTM